MFALCACPHIKSELPSYDLVVPALLEDGVEGLRNHCKLTPGVPLKPMLAKPTKAIGEVLDRFEGKGFTCEYKYDGERAQVSQVVLCSAEGNPVAYITLHIFECRFISCPTASLQYSVETRKSLRLVGFDGPRADASSDIISACSENMSVKYPDLVEQVPRVSYLASLFCASRGDLITLWSCSAFAKESHRSVLTQKPVSSVF